LTANTNGKAMAEEQTTEVAEKPAKPIVKIAIMAVIALVLVGGGVGATLFLTGALSSAPSAEADDEEAEAPAPAHGEKKDGHGEKKDPHGEKKEGHGEKKEGHGEKKGGEAKAETGASRMIPETAGARFEKRYMDLDDKKALVANVAGSRKVMQVSLSLMTQYDERVFKNVETHRAALRSACLDVLRTVTEPDLAKPEFRLQLTGRLRDRINIELDRLEGFGGIEEVFFTEFVYQ
jgi:flagellar FliL protein